MCGIMGATGIPSADGSLECVRRMGSLLMHRGPDAWANSLTSGLASATPAFPFSTWKAAPSP